MTLVEALIIYLSAGAPFGVLIFFSQHASSFTAIGYSILATVAWPLVAAQRVFRSLSGREGRKKTYQDVSPFEVLQSLAAEVPGETFELFEVAGHPNPWLATNCYARSRKRVIRSHIERLDAPPSFDGKQVQITRTPEYSPTAAAVIGH